MSAEARRYRKAVADTVLIARQPGLPLVGRLAVQLTLTAPDRRRRDLDNCLKATLDALTHAGVWADDSQIDRIEVVRAGVCRDAPGVAVTILESA